MLYKIFYTIQTIFLKSKRITCCTGTGRWTRAPSAPALPPSPNVVRAEAQRRGFGWTRSNDPPQRIEHLSGGRLHPRGAHHPPK
jgi:hypothetical protein